MWSLRCSYKHYLNKYRECFCKPLLKQFPLSSMMHRFFIRMVEGLISRRCVWVKSGMNNFVKCTCWSLVYWNFIMSLPWQQQQQKMLTQRAGFSVNKWSVCVCVCVCVTQIWVPSQLLVLFQSTSAAFNSLLSKCNAVFFKNFEPTFAFHAYVFFSVNTCAHLHFFFLKTKDVCDFLLLYLIWLWK